jgi:predicted ester cyclase
MLGDTMSVQDNVIAARRLLEKGFGDGDLAVVDQYVADDFVEHQNGVQGIGPDAVKEIITSLHRSLTGMSYSIEAVVAGRDTVWLRSRVRAQNTLPFMGWPATGREIEIDVFDELRFSAGKAIEHWGVADRLGLLEQLGAANGEARRVA